MLALLDAARHATRDVCPIGEGEESAGLRVAEGRGAAFVARQRTFDAVHRIADDRIVLAEIIKQ
jgi:hypothetical protein